MTQHYYDVRLERDLGEIRDQVSQTAGLVAKAIRLSVDALERRDNQLAYQTIVGDNPINRAVEECDRACHQFVARHLPAAGHLRFISSVMRLNVGLERVGDYAVTVCRVVVKLNEEMDHETLERIKVIAVGSTEMFEQAIAAFVAGNAELARGTIAYESQIDRSYGAALKHILATGIESSSNVADLYGKLVILSALERISDQAKNICELTVFAETGETKQRKPVPVYFVDRDNSGLAPMAVSIARKAFPDHGVYTAASHSVSSEIDHEVVAEMERLGHNPRTVPRVLLSELVSNMSSKAVIVLLDGEPGDDIGEVPFNASVLRWPLSREGGFEQLYRTMTAEIGDLMTTLRGEQP